MRTSVVVALLVVPLSSARADQVGGSSGGGGGALSQVSSGISAASHASSSPSAGSTAPVPVYTAGYTGSYYPEGASSYPLTGAGPAPEPANYTGDRARLELYAGAQTVHDSNGAWRFEASVTDFRLRIKVEIARYFETLSSGAELSMTMPRVTLGWRVNDFGPTAVYLEGGGINATTRGDEMADSSIAGPLVGARVEHELSRRASVIGDVGAMWFGDGIRAGEARVGLRYAWLEGSVRVLAFNVGPALYGPELGLRF